MSGALSDAVKLGRKHMGGGEFLMAAEAPYSFQISTLQPKELWRPRDPGDQIRPVFPGAAVIVDGSLYEVIEVRQPETTDGRYDYLLAPWEERNPLRGDAFEYSMEAVREERRAMAQAMAADSVGTRLDWFGVFVALLPAKEQARLYRVYGFERVFWTKWSALFWTVMLFGAAITTLVHYFPRGSSILWLLLILVFIVEQFYRRAQTTVGEACGSMIGFPILAVLKLFRGESLTD